MKKITIAIDGPAGSGKSTTARLVAQELNYLYIDTGAMYRAVTLAWIRSGSELNEDMIKSLVDTIDIKLFQDRKGNRTILDGIDVSDEIRKPDVTKYVSPISAIQYVREKMVAFQRQMGSGGGVVLDGRDIGTVVFPLAELKIFLIASIEARAIRRTLELMDKGIDCDIEEIQKQIEERDRYDSSREYSPLRKAPDAIEIDTSNLTIRQQTEKVLEIARSIIFSKNN